MPLSTQANSSTRPASVFEAALDELVSGLTDREDFTEVWAPQESPIGPPHPQIELLDSNCPEIFYGGARGGGKTDGILGKWLQHRQRWRGMARGVFFRRRQIHLEETIARTHELFPLTGARWVGSPRQVWIWSDGSTLKFRHLWDIKAAENYQGHAYSFIAFEEVQQWPDPEPLNLLRATLRSAAGATCALMASGNPGGVGHQWVKAYYIDPGPKGYEKIHDPVTGVDRLFIPARLEDNPALTTNDPTYERRLLAASKNPALVRAWRYGDWDVVAGGYFEDVWNQETQVLEPFIIPDGWWLVRSFDWGSAKPSSLGLWGVSNGESLDRNGGPYPGRTFPPGTFIRIGELYTVERDANGQAQPNKGTRMQNPDLGRLIEEVSKEVAEGFAGGRDWDYSYADPSIFDEEGGESIYEQMRGGTEHDPFDFDRADNSRVPGWQRCRAMLSESSNARPENAGLYAFKGCREWLRTFPVLPTDDRKLDDVDTDAEDHTGDETRYAVQTFSQTTATSQEVLY